MNIAIPEVCLVVLIGPSGSGKSSFARRFFDPTEILSPDHCRALVSDDENDPSATGDAFDVLCFIAGKRLARQRLTVIDAINVQPEARKPLVALARQHHCLPVAIVLDMPPRLCQERISTRKDRDIAPHLVRQQSQQLAGSIRELRREGFLEVAILTSPMQVDLVSVERVPLWPHAPDPA